MASPSLVLCRQTLPQPLFSNSFNFCAQLLQPNLPGYGSSCLPDNEAGLWIHRAADSKDVGTFLGEGDSKLEPNSPRRSRWIVDCLLQLAFHGQGGMRVDPPSPSEDQGEFDPRRQDNQEPRPSSIWRAPKKSRMRFLRALSHHLLSWRYSIWCHHEHANKTKQIQTDMTGHHMWNAGNRIQNYFACTPTSIQKEIEIEEQIQRFFCAWLCSPVARKNKIVLIMDWIWCFSANQDCLAQQKYKKSKIAKNIQNASVRHDWRSCLFFDKDCHDAIQSLPSLDCKQAMALATPTYQNKDVVLKRDPAQLQLQVLDFARSIAQRSRAISEHLDASCKEKNPICFLGDTLSTKSAPITTPRCTNMKTRER